MACYKKFQKLFATDPNPNENRWLEQPLFYNPKIRWGPGKKEKTFIPQSFGLLERASVLSLGQLSVNLKPISPENLEILGFKTNTTLDHQSLTLNLATLIFEGKKFNAIPTLVSVKSDPSKKLPGNLFCNIKDYLASYLKGSSKTRLILTRAHQNLINPKISAIR